MPESDCPSNRKTSIIKTKLKTTKMKRLIVMVLVLVIGTTMSLQAQNSKKETIKIKTNAYSAKSDEIFKENLPFVKGVNSYEFCFHSSTLTVNYNPSKTTPAKIKAEVSKLGFDADEVKGDAKARAKLPKECTTPSTKGGCSRSCGSH
jgi:copper chaperone CopZ